MEVKFFNSQTKEKEVFQPDDPKNVKIYSCGPTVYNFNHIGNFRSYIFVDTLRRSLKLLGYGINHTMNITDIDDKIIQHSIDKGVSIEEFTAPWVQAFFEDLETLQIDKVEHYPRATEHIPGMLELVTNLQKNGYTYEKEGSLYYSIKNFSSYGKLSKVDTAGIKSGTRYDADEYEKDDVRDFVLWKAPKLEKEKSWETPFGKGRPGWHLECSAMIRQIYQSGIDIHTGGIDLLFPHHENEIAQSEAAYPGESFVNLWMHCEHLLVDNTKMSKKLGNFYTLRDLIAKGYSPKAIRYLLLSFHYRTKLNFSLSRIEEAEKSIERIQNTLNRILEKTGLEEALSSHPESYALAGYQSFLESLADDLNVPKALGEIFEFCRQVNADLDAHKINPEEAKDIQAYFSRINDLLALLSFQKEKAELLDSEIEDLIQKRVEARKAKNFQLADEIRDSLKEKGIILEDTKEGLKWKRSS
ncbi:MAG: cysteine--tRNA ligase [Leptospiraceae bacterium]|nr:cysteine--tRNA ligase [Leptospiraceae bacterium]MCP5502788.1 cysteine--tRNA ligase [Leptospiraceae bacterium]